MTHFFLYPEGHLGLTAVTFLIVLPLMQVIVVLAGVGVEICGVTVFEAEVVDVVGVGNGVSWVNFT